MVNIKDIDKLQPSDETSSLHEASSSGDKLDDIFRGQKFLMDRYLPIMEGHLQKVYGSGKVDPKAWEGGEFNLHTKLGNVLIKEFTDATIHELSEAVQTLKNWKSWKQTEMKSDSDHWKEEMVDALHFYIETLILAGVTPEELRDLYFKKNKVNQFRQESKY